MKILPTLGRRWRTTPLAIFIVAALIVLGGIAVIAQSEGAYITQREEAARIQAGIMGQSVAAAVDFNDLQTAEQTAFAFSNNPAVRLVAIYDRDGQLIAGQRRQGNVPATLRELGPSGPQGLRGVAPIQSAGQRIGTAIYELDREPVYRRLTRYATLAALLLLAALVVGSLGIVQGTLRRANRQLGDRAEALAQANQLLEEQIEERAKAEEQLRQSQKMQALGQLTGGIAHDFNNLLTVIQGSADMLCKDELPEAKRKRFAQAIVQAAGNAAALTSQLLAFARRQPLKPEHLDVNAVIRDIGDLVDRTMGERIEVRTRLQAKKCAVEVDRAQLQSAILNIASNARDAMKEGGRLTISTRTEESEDGARMIAVDIADTGTGMDEATRERVFEPFFTTKGTGEGTGLGLSQVYGFATQSGGEVRVDSEPGKGSRLTIVLPCHAATLADPVVGEVVEAAPHAPAAILIVEDNEEVGAFAETLLAELGHSVTRVHSGEQALELVRAQEFDVVFSDVVMPGMGGLKLAEALAVEKPTLPVVLATGYSQEIALAGSGGRPVISKPYRLATLSEALATAMRAARTTQ
jgi:signal transduction histidine kinase/ActR/RegA family two-component response regulator